MSKNSNKKPSRHGHGRRNRRSRSPKRHSAAAWKAGVKIFYRSVSDVPLPGASIDVRIRGEVKFYDIAPWVTLKNKSVSDHAGMGVSEKTLGMRARAAIKSVIQKDYIDTGRFGRVERGDIEDAIERALMLEIETTKEQQIEEVRRERVVRDKMWEVFLSRGRESVDVVEKRMRDYHRERDFLANQSGNEKLEGRFTARDTDSTLIRIGLDFGTTSIKAAYRDIEAEKTIPVRFSQERGIDAFILTPSLSISNGSVELVGERTTEDLSWKRCLSCVHGGRLSCNKKQNGSCPLTTVKRSCDTLAALSDEEAALFLTSVYLGFVLERVRKAIRSDLAKRFPGRRHRFRVHMCVPVGEMQNELCRMVFQDALTLADQMFSVVSFGTGSVPIDELYEKWRECRRLGILTRCESERESRVFPEVNAEMASYAKSKAAAEGTYALIDIGGGTVDINVFRWVEPSATEGVRTPVYAAFCDATGVLALEERLIEAIGPHEHTCSFDRQKAERRFPDTRELSRMANGVRKEELQDELDSVFKAFCKALADKGRGTWGKARRRRRKESWKSLGVFIGGGGASIRKLAELVEDRVRNELLDRLEVRPLPLPDADEFEKVPGFPDEEFHREAVAYGLTVAPEFESGLMGPADIPEPPPRTPVGPYGSSLGWRDTKDLT